MSNHRLLNTHAGTRKCWKTKPAQARRWGCHTRRKRDVWYIL